MSVKEQVLEILENNRGEDISGAQIAQMLSVSRNAVWKAVNQLKQEGHNIDAVTNRGYRLAPRSDALSAPSIEKHLKTRCTFEIFKTTTSTNDVAKSMAEEGAAEWTIVLAEEQTKGKGRLGRSFYSPEGTGIYMSIVLRPSFPAQQALLITTAAAVAVAQVLEENGCEDVKIKWVNDVYSSGKKVCGILTEGSLDFESGMLNYAVLGIGINVTRPKTGFPEDIENVAGAAFVDANVLRSKMIVGIIDSFSKLYANLTDKPHLDKYRHYSLFDGQRVTVYQANEKKNAAALGIDDDFRLIVRYDDGERESLSSGEVSVRSQESENRPKF